MIEIIGVAALRTLISGYMVEGAFRYLRVEHPIVRKAAWAFILLSGFVMPLLQMHSLLIRLPIRHGPTTLIMTLAAAQSENATPFVSGTERSGRAALIPTAVAGQSFGRHGLERAMLVIYLLPASVLLLRIAFGLLLAMRTVSRSLPVGTLPNAKLRLCSEIATPWTVGSVILLPATAAWNEDQIRLVLAHEHCHVRHLDFYLQLAARIYAAIFWFSPFGWWVLRECERLGEETSDRAALSVGGPRWLYAELLLRFSSTNALPVVSMARQSSIRARLERIFDHNSLNEPFAHPTRAAFHASLIVILAVMAGSLGLKAQTPGESHGVVEQQNKMAADANPAFLLATIKPTDPNTSRQGWSFESEGRHITCFNVTLRDMVTMAYGVHAKQIVAAPEWFYKDHYDVSGVPDQPGVPNLKQEQHMYQQLLAERFHLMFDREQREIPIYAITIVKGGPKLTPADPKEVPNTASSGGSGFRTLKFENISMPDLAVNLNFYEDRPVLDETSLKGRYDFTLKWAYDLNTEGRADMPPPLFTAIKEQAGLQINAERGLADVFVVKHVDRPSPN